MLPAEGHQDFALRRSQKFGAGLLAILVVALPIMLFNFHSETVGSLNRLSDGVSTTNNLILAEQESLQFAASFERWLSGISTVQTLRIRRSELAERLAAKDNSGVSTSERVKPDYLETLGALDVFMRAAPMGLLPTDDRSGIRSRSESALNSFVMHAHEMAALSSDADAKPLIALFEDGISRQENRDTNVLLVLSVIFVVTGLLVISRVYDFRKIRIRMVAERQILDELNNTLQRVDGELQQRIENDRLDRMNREWIDTGVDSISTQMKSTVVPDEVSDLLVEGLGRTLRADFVIFYSFGKFKTNELWRQWSQSASTQIDFSRIAKYQSSLADFTKRLDEGSHAIAVSDSHLVDVSRGPYPEIVAIAKEIARSWVLAPVGETSYGLGYVWIGMVDDIRVWSKAEVEFVQKITIASAQILTHAWMFNQSMQIAENDGEVSRLSELDKVKNDFIANLNHELRSPLTSIVGYLEVAIEGVNADADPALASSLTAVQRNAQRLQVLMDNMMQILKRDFEQMPLAVVSVDVGRLLVDGVNSLHPSATARAVTMTLQLDSAEGDLVIDGDGSQLEQVFVNLISNAIKFTPRGGTVTVVARRAGTEVDFVEVTVADTGIGIPPEEFPNVFNRFFRASTAKQAAIPGYGIGLSLVKSIVQEHLGTITFDSKVGGGTVFKVKLPLRYKTPSEIDQAK